MDRIQLNKKGIVGLGDAVPIIVILMTIGIVLTIGMLISGEIQDQAISTVGTVTTLISNETETTPLDQVGFILDGVAGTQINRVVAVIVATNSSLNGNLETTDFIINSSNGLFTLVNASGDLGSGDLNITYTITEAQRREAVNATISTQEGLDAIASFQSIFGIVVAAAIVLGVIALFR